MAVLSRRASATHPVLSLNSPIWVNAVSVSLSAPAALTNSLINVSLASTIHITGTQ